MGIKLKTKKNDNKKIESFDYGTINDRDKQVVEEVIKLLNLKDGPESELLKEKFKIEPLFEVPYDKSIFYTICKELGIFVGHQGFIQEGKIKYPIFSICADCRELDKLVMVIVKKYEKFNK